MTEIRIRLSANAVAHILTSIALWLATASLIGKYVQAILGVEEPYFIALAVRFLNINREGSLPTWYNTILLLGAAATLAVIAYTTYCRSGRYVRHWLSLAIIFTLMSIDEAISIHEKFTMPLQDTLHAEGYFYFAWLWVGIPLVLIVALFYIRFLLHLPPRTRHLIVMAGACYVGGALGIEAVGANRWYLDGGGSLLYSIIGTVEEFCEMLGVITLIYALLDYLDTSAVNIQFILQRAQNRQKESLAEELSMTLTRHTKGIEI